VTEIAQLLDRARSLLVANQPAEARTLLMSVVRQAPHDCDAVHLLAVACFTGGDAAEALPLFRKSVELAPSRRDFWTNYIAALSRFPQHAHEMLSAADQALRRFPDLADVWLLVSDHYRRQGEFAHRVNVLRHAIQALPHNVTLRLQLADCYQQGGQFDQAIAVLNPVLSDDPHHIEALRQLGTALNSQGNIQQACICWEKILAVDPHDEDALVKLVVGRRKCCDWRDFDALATQLRERTETNLQAGKPPLETVLVSLSTSMDGNYQFRLAKSWAESRGQRYRPRYSHSNTLSRPVDSGQIILGYVSDEFRDHPIGLLMRDYFKHHDRNRFRVIVYFDNPPDENDPVFQSIKSSCEESRLVAGMPHEQLADLIHRDGVDILLDLKGWRQGNRLAVFAMRPAPIGVAFQGFPGTTGAAYLDYVIVDDYIVPENESGQYAEKLAYLGRCYQVNAESKPTYEELRTHAGTRADHGLPQDAVVLASFNQAYKLEPQMVDVWLDIMRHAENSVLWLLELNEACRANLRKFAAEHGISPDRLIFAPWANHDAHLARLTHADLGLDTRNYTGHATTSDSLWCKVPVITLSGRHFASRVSASILREVGLNELIVEDVASYRDLALRLIDDETFRDSFRHQLTTEHLRATLFNTADYVRQMEDLFQQMHALHRQGQPPRMLRCRL
jgi:predicted O-linked N-acetylglucosamine transferase (SPINDLY family)